MNKLISLGVLLLFVGFFLQAQEKTTTTIKGYVVDQNCAKRMATKADVMERAAKHTRECALDDACAASGYGIFSEGKYYKFDEHGNKLAKELLEKSKREKGIYMEASGKLGDGMLEVASLKEIPEMKSKKEMKHS
jgi:hypothetical protein